MKYVLLISGILLGSFGLQAQKNVKKWSLEDCIKHAIENNISIKQLKIQQEDAEIQLNTAKMSRVPDMNARLTQDWSWGRGPTANNIIGNKTSSYSNLGISSSTPIYTGGRITNQIAMKEFDLQTALQSLERAKEDLSLNVASLFLDVLFNKELLKVSEEQLALSQMQVKRTKTLVEVGKVPTSQLYDIDAQAAKDEVSVIQAKNNLELSLLDLAQRLELERSGPFDVEVPVIKDVIGEYMSSVLPPTVVYDNAVAIKPVVKEQELKLESSKKALKVAESGYYPNLDLNVSYGNNYYYDYKLKKENKSFSDQLKDNSGESVGFSLSIPIFNRFQVRNQVRSAKLNIQNQQFELENTKKTLYKEIQTAYLNATAAQEKYKSSARAVTASQESFKYAQERYEIGKSSVFEFNESKTKLIQSQSEQIQAKYDYIFRTKILDFYNGVPIEL